MAETPHPEDLKNGYYLSIVRRDLPLEMAGLREIFARRRGNHPARDSLLVGQNWMVFPIVCPDSGVLQADCVEPFLLAVGTPCGGAPAQAD